MVTKELPMPGSAKADLADTIKVGATYLIGYWLLDWISFIYPFETLNITPWNPPIAVSVVLLITKGLKWAPMLFLGAFGADVLVRHMSAPIEPTLVTDLSEAFVYSGAVWLMQRLKMNADLRSFRDIVIFILVVSTAAALMATTYIASFSIAGLIPSESTLFLIMKYWVGDTIGITVLAPVLLIHRSKIPTIAQLLHGLTWEFFFQSLSFVFALWAMFFWQDPIFGHVFYPMLIPLIWVTAKKGLPGAVILLVLIQVSIIGGIELLHPVTKPQALTVTRLQFLMLAMSSTGLLLGAVISERERARSSAATAEARMRSIINTSPDGMIIVDDAGMIEFVNRSLEAINGRDAHELVGQPIANLFPLAKEHQRFETTVVHPKGWSISVDVSTATVMLNGRKTSVITVRDISERKEAELSLRQRMSAAGEISKSNVTEELAAILAHEINQPLSAIINYASACEAVLATVESVPVQASQQLTKIMLQAKRAGMVIADLREFVRSSKINSESVAISSMVRGVLLLLADDIGRAGAHVQLNIDDCLIAYVDRLQIEQVLINLIRNSLDAVVDSPMEQRKIQIDGKLLTEEMLEIEVSDTGPGISPEVSESLFDPFVTTRSSGMGLGLAISRSIIEAHGGKLRINPLHVPGASFTFTLPHHRPENAE
jgi:two-component system sensor kinase FixL